MKAVADFVRCQGCRGNHLNMYHETMINRHTAFWVYQISAIDKHDEQVCSFLSEKTFNLCNAMATRAKAAFLLLAFRWHCASVFLYTFFIFIFHVVSVPACVCVWPYMCHLALMSLDEQQQVICDLLNLTQQWQGEVKSVCQCVYVRAKPPAAEKVRYIDFVPKRQTRTGRQMDYSGGAVSLGPLPCQSP